MSNYSRRADEALYSVDYWLERLAGFDCDYGITNTTSLEDYTLLELKEFKNSYEYVKEYAEPLDALRKKIGEKKKLIDAFFIFENIIDIAIATKIKQEEPHD